MFSSLLPAPVILLSLCSTQYIIQIHSNTSSNIQSFAWWGTVDCTILMATMGASATCLWCDAIKVTKIQCYCAESYSLLISARASVAKSMQYTCWLTQLAEVFYSKITVFEVGVLPSKIKRRRWNSVKHWKNDRPIDSWDQLYSVLIRHCMPRKQERKKWDIKHIPLFLNSWELLWDNMLQKIEAKKENLWKGDVDKADIETLFTAQVLLAFLILFHNVYPFTF